MNLKEQTVYIPTKNKTDFQISDPNFGIIYSTVKTTYCLSKKELIELLGSAFNQLADANLSDEYHGNGHNLPLSYKEQFINQLIR
jgi:hypothetical protein